MTKDDLITVSVGTTLDERRRSSPHKVEKLLVVDREFNLKGLITVKDIQKQIKYPNACKTRSAGSGGGRGRTAADTSTAWRPRRGEGDVSWSTPRTATAGTCARPWRSEDRTPRPRGGGRQCGHFEGAATSSRG